MARGRIGRSRDRDRERERASCFFVAAEMRGSREQSDDPSSSDDGARARMHARTWSMSLGLGRFMDWMRLVAMVLNACFSNVNHTRHRDHKTENFGFAGIMSENKRGIHLGWR